MLNAGVKMRHPQKKSSVQYDGLINFSNLIKILIKNIQSIPPLGLIFQPLIRDLYLFSTVQGVIDSTGKTSNVRFHQNSRLYSEVRHYICKVLNIIKNKPGKLSSHFWYNSFVSRPLVQKRHKLWVCSSVTER